MFNRTNNEESPMNFRNPKEPNKLKKQFNFALTFSDIKTCYKSAGQNCDMVMRRFDIHMPVSVVLFLF